MRFYEFQFDPLNRPLEGTAPGDRPAGLFRGGDNTPAARGRARGGSAARGGWVAARLEARSVRLLRGGGRNRQSWTGTAPGAPVESAGRRQAQGADPVSQHLQHLELGRADADPVARPAGGGPSSERTTPPIVSSSRVAELDAAARPRGPRPASRPRPGRRRPRLSTSSGRSESNSSWIWPTISSITFSSVTMPETPPYSSSTAARWKRSARMPREQAVEGRASRARRRSVARAPRASAGGPPARKRSLMWIRPTTWSRSPSQSGKRVWPLCRASAQVLLDACVGRRGRPRRRAAP